MTSSNSNAAIERATTQFTSPPARLTGEHDRSDIGCTSGAMR
jgi:hypothetical protein